MEAIHDVGSMITLKLNVLRRVSSRAIYIIDQQLFREGIRIYAAILVTSHLENLRKEYILGWWL